MVKNGAVPKEIFLQVDQTHIADIYYQVNGYFGLIAIGNVGNNVLTNPLVISDLQILAGDPQQIKIILQVALRYDIQGN